MDILSGVLSAFGLSASAGLNAYVPLLIVSLMARYTDWITLAPPWDAMASGWVITAIVLLGLIEFFADKIPAVNHVNDAIQTVVRPTAGAILFAANGAVVSEVHPVLALIAGLLLAGGVHAAKSAAIRPVVTASTGGSGNVPVSLAEDVLATVLSILSVVLPIVIGALIIVLTALFVWLLWRRARLTTAA
ncbi:MAG: DUF4126 domain-containing protein [Anaerolineales bacterium]|nr:DUF4126 domain-containing protein [Anaerolineales bacterium]